MPDEQDPFEVLNDALSVVFDGIAIARKGLLKNPDVDQRRKLLGIIARLEVERTEISAAMDALIDEDQSYPAPTSEQVAAIARLTGEVEGTTNSSLTASGAVDLTGRILGMAASLADV